jgi:hypothetical protein
MFPCYVYIYYYWKESWNPIQENKVTGKQSAVNAAICSGVAVLQLHQEGGNHAYMPLN